MHYSQDLQPLYSEKKKMGPTTLFTHLKIILLQCFQFSVFSKISCIRTNPTYFEILTIDYMFFIFLTHISSFEIIGYYLLYHFSKISCIRMDPTYFENLTIDYMFFIFLTHMSNFVIIGYYLLYDAKTYF